MKVKRVCFGEDSRDTVKVPGFPGRHQELHVGKVADPSRDNPVRCEITALDFDQRSGALMIHKKPHDAFDQSAHVNPARAWNFGTAENQKCEADFCILMVPTRTTVYGDDPVVEAKPAQKESAAVLPQCSKCGKDSQGEPLCAACMLAERDKTEAKDPPPAQPVQKQGQTRR